MINLVPWRMQLSMCLRMELQNPGAVSSWTAEDWVLRVGRPPSLSLPPARITSDGRQVNKDRTGRTQGWDSGLPGSKPLVLSFDRTLDNIFPFLGA